MRRGAGRACAVCEKRAFKNRLHHKRRHRPHLEPAIPAPALARRSPRACTGARAARRHGQQRQRSVPAARILDVPGYGFARVPYGRVADWHAMLGVYLQERGPQLLARAYVLLDARRVKR